ncbi:MAG: hypothetical protein ACR2J6_00715 [Thermoleophilaceae bacterium]
MALKSVFPLQVENCRSMVPFTFRPTRRPLYSGYRDNILVFARAV